MALDRIGGGGGDVSLCDKRWMMELVRGGV